MLPLTETQKEMFKQAALDGSNKTSQALSEMFDSPVKLIAVNQSVLSIDELQTFFSSSKLRGTTITISQKIDGEFSGYSFLPISRQEAKHLVHLLSFASADYHNDLSFEECNILIELNNIIGGYLAGSISDSIGIKISATGISVMQQIESQDLLKIFENFFNISSGKFLVFESGISVFLGKAPFFSVIGFTSKSWNRFSGNGEQDTGEDLALPEKDLPAP